MADRSPLNYRTVFSTPWFAIEESAAPANATGAYYRMTGPDGVICLPLTVEGDIVMVRQYRPSLNMETLEIPAGAIDGSESSRKNLSGVLPDMAGQAVAVAVSMEAPGHTPDAHKPDGPVVASGELQIL